MKIRNKKTGEILEIEKIVIDDIYTVNSVSGLADNWEDYEEPKVAYFINAQGYVIDFSDGYYDDWTHEEQIGNKFETKEEAEKAVEKLKAWKLQKDKGFDIESWDTNIGDNYYKTGQIVLNLNNVKNREWDEYTQIEEIKNDLNLLFGGENGRN